MTSSHQAGLQAQRAKTQSKKLDAKGTGWLLKATGRILLVTFCLSLVYISFILMDALVQYLAVLTLGDLIQKYVFVENAINGVKIFSAIIIGLVYLFHLLYAVFDQVRFVLRVSKQFQDEEDEELEK